jgi:hypothetical protein
MTLGCRPGRIASSLGTGLVGLCQFLYFFLNLLQYLVDPVTILRPVESYAGGSGLDLRSPQQRRERLGDSI